MKICFINIFNYKKYLFVDKIAFFVVCNPTQNK